MMIICASCGETTATGSPACVHCRQDWRLDGRYALEARLGHGASGTTYRARRLADGEALAIKELLVRRLEDFKAHDLFAREAAVLESLRHPGIPRYHDDFTAGSGRHLGLYLVTELIDGQTLEEELASRRHSQREVIAIIRELCDVLSYLHNLAPPVVHRDIKPANIMRRRSDQSLVLIDFGAVKESLRGGDLGGSTVAGTFGYMPPEQLVGRASPASDLYALGVLLVALTTRLPLSEMTDDLNRLQWNEHMPRGTRLADGVRDLLVDVLELDPARRLADAEELKRRLEAIEAGTYNPRPRFQPLSAAALLATQGPGVAPATADPPPPAPRKLSFGAIHSADPAANFFVLFGALFGGIPTVILTGLLIGGVFDPEMLFLLIFTFIGGGMLAAGLARRGRQRRLFRDGVAAEAIVTAAGYDTSLQVNGKSPYKVTFRYQTPDGTLRESSVSRFRVDPGFRVAGARVYALYDPQHPSRATMWPIG